MKIFETHAHYDDDAYNEDREAVIDRLKSFDVERVVNIGSNMETSRNTDAFTKKYDFFYGAVGVHPSDTGDMKEADIDELKEMVRNNPKIVAIGEIGLDYHWPEPGRDVQKKWFIRQLELARELGKPVVIHSRDAAEDTITILEEEKVGEIGGVMHCYSYSKEIAERVLRMGLYIGVGGVITFKNGRKLVETVEETPIERIVVETDSPYLAPEPYRGRRNTSANLRLIVSRIAEIKGLTPDEVAEITYENALRMYRIINDDTLD
ncbi:MAG: TatD family hydrolase [Eubacterium sp.]|nr:TatD family hydrolase [Eubacterium sp.]